MNQPDPKPVGVPPDAIVTVYQNPWFAVRRRGGMHWVSQGKRAGAVVVAPAADKMDGSPYYVMIAQRPWAAWCGNCRAAGRFRASPCGIVRCARGKRKQAPTSE